VSSLETVCHLLKWRLKSTFAIFIEFHIAPALQYLLAVNAKGTGPQGRTAAVDVDFDSIHTWPLGTFLLVIWWPCDMQQAGKEIVKRPMSE